jgi:hypothetical protein
MAGESIFGLGNQLDLGKVSVCFIAVVLFTLAWEALTHYLEHRLRNTAYYVMLSKASFLQHC